MPAKYKKRKDGRYARQIKIGYNPDGRPKFKTIYGKTNAELERKVTDFLSLKNKGIVIADSKITLREWAEKWLAAYKANMEYNTYIMYARCVHNHITPAPFANIPISKIKTSDLQNLVNMKLEQGLTRTVVMIRLTLRQMFSQAIENDLLYKNVADYVKLPTIKAKPKRALTDIERSAIRNAELLPRERVYIYIGLFAGLRKGEILALTRQDIDLKNRLIHVRRSLVIKEAEGEIKNCPKTDAGRRSVPIPDKLYAVLAPYIASLNGMMLFTKRDGNIFNRSAFRRFWENIAYTLNAAAGGKDNLKLVTFTSHILRHTYATTLLESGINVKTVQKLLGHKNIAMTLDIYNHINPAPEALLEQLNSAVRI